MSDHDIERETRLLQQQWHGWASPIGMGIGMVCTGAFFTLIAIGLSVLASIE